MITRNANSNAGRHKIRRRWRLLAAVTYAFILCCALPVRPWRTGWAASSGQSNALPDGEGKGLVLAACTQCHNLGSIVLQRKTIDGWDKTVRDMVSRGAQLRPDEIPLISDY